MRTKPAPDGLNAALAVSFGKMKLIEVVMTLACQKIAILAILAGFWLPIGARVDVSCMSPRVATNYVV